MAESDRRRSERHPVDIPGTLYLSDGREVPVRIQNLGELGALVRITDLEEAVLEGERAVLQHPVTVEGVVHHGEIVRTAGAVVRVELDFEEQGIARELAVYFDGGAKPEGCAV
jgi:hypothetical protein